MNDVQKLICEISGYEPTKDFTSARNDSYYELENRSDRLGFLIEFVGNVDYMNLKLSAYEYTKALSFLDHDFTCQNEMYHEFDRL